MLFTCIPSSDNFIPLSSDNVACSHENNYLLLLLVMVVVLFLINIADEGRSKGHDVRW